MEAPLHHFIRAIHIVLAIFTIKTRLSAAGVFKEGAGERRSIAWTDYVELTNLMSRRTGDTERILGTCCEVKVGQDDSQNQQMRIHSETRLERVKQLHSKTSLSTISLKHVVI